MKRRLKPEGKVGEVEGKIGEYRKNIFRGKSYFPVIRFLLNSTLEYFTYNDISHLIKQTTWTNRVRKKLIDFEYIYKIDNPKDRRIQTFRVNKRLAYYDLERLFKHMFARHVYYELLKHPTLSKYTELIRKVNRVNYEGEGYELAIKKLNSHVKEFTTFANSIIYIMSGKKNILEDVLTLDMFKEYSKKNQIVMNGKKWSINPDYIPNQLLGKKFLGVKDQIQIAAMIIDNTFSILPDELKEIEAFYSVIDEALAEKHSTTIVKLFGTIISILGEQGEKYLINKDKTIKFTNYHFYSHLYLKLICDKIEIPAFGNPTNTEMNSIKGPLEDIENMAKIVKGFKKNER